MAATQTELIRRALLWLAQQDVREICVAAGARNAPIIQALAQSDGVILRHFFEERCAGFFALGSAMSNRRPVAVLTTSGTAAAALLPAMIEAHYQGLPLIALTADRPKSYRGSGAPQAIEQAALFHPYAGLSLDLDINSDPTSWNIPPPPQKPIHLNLCLDEPLDLPVEGVRFSEVTPRHDIKATAPNAQPAELVTWLRQQERPIIAAAGLHPSEAAALTPLLVQLGVPIVAEATANLGGEGTLAPFLVAPRDAAIASLDPTAILRIGAVPSGRWWRDLETQSSISVLSLSRSGHSGLARRSNVTSAAALLDQLASGISDIQPIWEPWAKLPPPGPSIAPTDEQTKLLELASVIPENALVFLGNSLPIREWNEVVGSTRPFRTFANRGANGIDGIVSTFLGLSSAETEAESWLILGDLSALYDLAAPWVLPQLPEAKRRIVVLNNRGGRIFSKVPSLRNLAPPTRSLIENPHTLSFKPWADLWNLHYRFATSPDDLLDLPEGTTVIEIPTEP